ncbi:MAG TPA: hypothetical protein VMV59_08355 [Candidatus Dormibacteraeota bacterium]|nr:hypothetical protein [Candidatus Dormibacteraeota bacterium]
MWTDPHRARQWRQAHAEEQKAYCRRRRTTSYGKPASAEQQAACIADPRKSLESKFGIVTANFVFCMLCWRRYKELGHHLGQCEERPPAWHGRKNLPDFYRDLVGLNHGTALACEAVRAERGEIADKHDLSEYAKKYREEHPDRIRPSNIGRKHSRQAQLNKSDRQRGIANRARQTVPDETILRYWLVEGFDLKAIARKTGKHASVIRARLERIFGTTVRRVGVFSDGQMVNGRWVEEAISSLQLQRRELESFIGMSLSWWLRSESLERPIRTVLAKSLIDARNWLTRRLVGGYSDHSKAALLVTVVSNLPQQHEEAEGAMTLLRKAPAFDQFVVGAPRDSNGLRRFRRVLGWISEISQAPRSSRSGTGFLAVKYGITAEEIRRALLERQERVPALAVRANVVSLLHEPRPRRRRGIREETRKRIKWAAAFQRAGFRQNGMAKFVFHDRPGSAEDNIRTLFHEHGEDIELTAIHLTDPQVRAIVSHRVRKSTQPKPL